MRIKFLEVFGAHAKDSFLTVDDEATAKRYIAAGVAEEAPEVPDVVKSMQALIQTVIDDARESVKAASKSVGPNAGRVEGAADPDDPREPVRREDRAEVKQAKFGHWLKSVGHINDPNTAHTVKESAGNWLANCYKSLPRDLDSDAPARTDFGQVKSGKVFDTKAANVEGSGPSLGYAVPTEFVYDIWKIAVEESVLASRAKRRPMSSNELRYPKLDQTGTQAAGVTGYFGGVVARWTKEAAARPETEPKLKQGSMKAGELTGYSIFGNELLQDNASGLAAMISELFGEATGYYLDYACLVGDGVDKPMGVVNAGATIQFIRKGGAGTATLDFTDLTAMKRRILPKYRKGAFWAVTLSAEDALWNVVDSGGRPLFLPNFPGTAGGPVTADVGSGVQNILGLPYEVTEKLPAYGTLGDIALIAPMGYMIGERMGLEIAASPHVYFLNNETVYRFVARVAGQPLLDKPYTAIDGATQASHFCVLK